jgi:hypothetical protein
MLPLYQLDCDAFQMPDVIGPASTAEIPMSQLSSDVLFQLAPLQHSDLVLQAQGIDVNDVLFARDARGSAPPPLTMLSGQSHALLDPGSFSVGDRQTQLASVSSRSLPELHSRDSLKLQNPVKPSFATKETVREQNRRAAARFRQRQKVKT